MSDITSEVIFVLQVLQLSEVSSLPLDSWIYKYQYYKATESTLKCHVRQSSLQTLVVIRIGRYKSNYHQLN